MTTPGGAFRYPFAYDSLVDLPEELRTTMMVDRDRALEDYLQNEGGGGDAVITVAASDTPDDLAAHADYVCDGTADEVEIQAALDSFDSGGLVVLLPGTFNTAAEIAPNTDQSLTGSGRTATTIVFDVAGYAINSSSGSVKIAHMAIDAEDASGGPVSVEGGTSFIFDCYLLQNSTSATIAAVSLGGTGSMMTNCHVVASDIGVEIPSGWDRVILSHCYIEADTGVVLDGCSFCVVSANQIRGVGAATGHGILAQGSADDNSVVSNIVSGYGVDGIRLINVSAATPDRNNVQLNKLFKVSGGGDGYGINIASGTGNLCANNFITGSGALGDFNDAGTDTEGTGGLAGGITSHDDLDDVSADDHHNQAHAINGADHTASGLTAGHVIRATAATTFAFGALQDGDIPSTIARDSEVTTAVSNHAAAADPHAGYVLESAHTKAAHDALGLSHDSLSDVSADDHHDQEHAHDGADGSGTVSHGDLTDVAADDHHDQSHAIDGADHTASGLTAGHVMRATAATTFAFGALQDGDIPSTIARDSEVTTAVSNHEAAADPHTGYLRESVVDAKGDLIVATADNTPARLAVSGNDGYVLTEDSSEATGVKWAAVPGGAEDISGLFWMQVGV